MTAADTLVFFSAVDPVEPWRDALASAVPDLAVRTADEIGPDDAVRSALVWKPPLGFFTSYPDLRLITILGAGVDALAGRPDLPPVPFARISDPETARMMTQYVLFAVLRYARDVPVFEQAQRERRWHQVHPRRAGRISVGVLGLGELGGAAAAELARQGFPVRGWSRSPKTIEGVTTLSGKRVSPTCWPEARSWS